MDFGVEKLKFEWPAWGLENRPNIDLVRFVRPENIRVLSRRWARAGH